MCFIRKYSIVADTWDKRNNAECSESCKKVNFWISEKRYQIRIFLSLLLVLLLLLLVLPFRYPFQYSVLCSHLACMWNIASEFGVVGVCAYALSALNVCASKCYMLDMPWIQTRYGTEVYLVQHTNIHIFPFLDLFSFSFSYIFFFFFFLQQNELKGKRRKKIGNRPVNTMLSQINKKSYIFARVLAFLPLSIAWQNKEKILEVWVCPAFGIGNTCIMEIFAREKKERTSDRRRERPRENKLNVHSETLDLNSVCFNLVVFCLLCVYRSSPKIGSHRICWQPETHTEKLIINTFFSKKKSFGYVYRWKKGTSRVHAIQSIKIFHTLNKNEQFMFKQHFTQTLSFDRFVICCAFLRSLPVHLQSSTVTR